VRRHPGQTLATIGAAAFAFVAVLLPLWILVVNSFKPYGEANELGISLPDTWAIGDNYSTVINEGEALRGLRNTLLISVPAIVITVLVGALAAWVFARSRSRVTGWLYALCISGILLPPAVVTTVLVLQETGLYGSFVGVIAFYVGVFLSFAIFFITGFVKTIPVELEEAARIEGCGPLMTFRLVVLPLLRPVIASTTVVVLLFVWNDFFFPFFLIDDDSRNTLTLGLYSFVSGYQNQIRWNLVFADVVVVSLPLLVVYAFAQRHIVAGLTGGAVNR
jgi:raffinose/stachyose/melibiose transport system permease protein